jgi:hypothetical protein
MMPLSGPPARCTVPRSLPQVRRRVPRQCTTLRAALLAEMLTRAAKQELRSRLRAQLLRAGSFSAHASAALATAFLNACVARDVRWLRGPVEARFGPVDGVDGADGGDSCKANHGDGAGGGASVWGASVCGGEWNEGGSEWDEGGGGMEALVGGSAATAASVLLRVCAGAGVQLSPSAAASLASGRLLRQFVSGDVVGLAPVTRVLAALTTQRLRLAVECIQAGLTRALLQPAGTRAGLGAGVDAVLRVLAAARQEADGLHGGSGNGSGGSSDPLLACLRHAATTLLDGSPRTVEGDDDAALTGAPMHFQHPVSALAVAMAWVRRAAQVCGHGPPSQRCPRAVLCRQHIVPSFPFVCCYLVCLPHCALCTHSVPAPTCPHPHPHHRHNHLPPPPPPLPPSTLARAQRLPHPPSHAHNVVRGTAPTGWPRGRERRRAAVLAVGRRDLGRHGSPFPAGLSAAVPAAGCGAGVRAGGGAHRLRPRRGLGRSATAAGATETPHP